MIPVKYFEQFVGKVINLGSDGDCLNGLTGRVVSVDQDGIIVMTGHDNTHIVADLRSVLRFYVGETVDRRFTEMAARADDDDDEDDDGASPLARLFGARGITVPPETQASVDALLADDEP